MTDTPAEIPVRISFARKWWTYQRERFPLVGHGLLIASFSFCAVALSRSLRGEPGWPTWSALLVAFVTCFAYFLQLRIADEFKDLEDDTRYRPYRPVPRGLVTLRELAVLFILAAILQLTLALWLKPALLMLLTITWLYLAAMSKEFFVGDWLRRRPIIYMLSHMVIMPLVDLYATSTDWLVDGSHPPEGLIWFLLASYCNGLVIELGRKIRAPADEETGVDTYSRIWGRIPATLAWLSAIAGTLAFAYIVTLRLQLPIIATILAGGFALSSAVAWAFLRQSRPGSGKWIETVSGLWTMLLYLSLGLIPLLWRAG